jgi:DNA-binding transcriptional ArsR family regulator
MKRDFELIRDILLKIEEADTFDQGIIIKIEGKSEEEIEYHLLLLGEDRLVELDDANKDFGVRPFRLTSQGHDFLDAARNATIWNKTQKFIKEKGGSVTLSIFKSLLTKALEKTFFE